MYVCVYIYMDDAVHDTKDAPVEKLCKWDTYRSIAGNAKKIRQPILSRGFKVKLAWKKQTYFCIAACKTCVCVLFDEVKT